MAFTDIIAVFLSIYFLSLGSLRGFMHSLMMPFSIIVTTIISIVYYQYTKNALISLLIGLIGPFLLNLILKFLLKIWADITKTNINPNFLSRLAGAAITLIWGWTFIILGLILLAVLPPWGESLRAVHHDVMKSMSYKIAKPWKESFFAPSIQNTATSPAGPSGSEAKSLANDPRFQKVLQDPEIQKEIDAHDLVKLLSNPKMMELTKQIMSDPETMKKVLAIYSSQSIPKTAQNN